MLQSYWGVIAPCNAKVKSLLKRHCQGYPVSASALYKELKGSDERANRDIAIKLIAARAPVDETISLKELETTLTKLDRGESLPATQGDIEFEAYQLPKLNVSQVCRKNYCKKGRCLASLAEAVIDSASNEEERKVADKVVSHYVTKHLLSQGYNLDNFLEGSNAIDWTESKRPITISWGILGQGAKDQKVDMFVGELAIINSGESLVMVDAIDQPIVPHNSKIYFKADREGSYPLTSFNNPGRIVTIEVYDKNSVLRYLPKLSKNYDREFLHRIRRWIELDNYLKSIEFNSLKAPLEDRRCILGEVCRSPADEEKLQEAISNNIVEKVSSSAMDPVCKVVFDTWKKNSTPETGELLMTCLVDGKVSLDRVTSVINKELTDNAMARERIQRELRTLLSR